MSEYSRVRSGVTSSALSSSMALAVATNTRSPMSSGRGVRTLTVADNAPSSRSAIGVLYTSTALTKSDGRILKSKLRLLPASTRSDVAIVRPFIVTMVKSGERPLTVTSPFAIVPGDLDAGNRAIDSARFWSRNFPMSSAEIASTIFAAERLMFNESCKLERMPTTTTSSTSSSSSSPRPAEWRAGHRRPLHRN